MIEGIYCGGIKLNTDTPFRTDARASIIAAGKRSNAHRRHLREAAHIEPGQYAETHSPTESVQVVFQHTANGPKTIEQGRRRITDKRLWDSLDIDMQEAMQAIQSGHSALIAGMGMKPASWERMSGGKGDMSQRQGLAAAAYNGWFEEVDHTLKLGEDHEPMKLGRGKAKNRWTLERLSPEAASSIICMGNSIDQTARDYHKDTRWVRDNLIQALKVWLYRTNKLRRPGPFVESADRGLTLQQVKIRQLNRRVERFADVIMERQRVIRAA